MFVITRFTCSDSGKDYNGLLDDLSLATELHSLGMTMPYGVMVDIYVSTDWFVIGCTEMITDVINTQAEDAPA